MNLYKSISRKTQNVAKKILKRSIINGGLQVFEKYFKLRAKSTQLFFAPLFNLCPPLCGEKVITGGGGGTFVTFILMIWLSVLFWHCIFSKTGSPNKHMVMIFIYIYLQPPPSQAVRQMHGKVSCLPAKVRGKGISLVLSLNSHVYWDSLFRIERNCFEITSIIVFQIIFIPIWL